MTTPNILSAKEVFEHIQRERTYQDEKYGVNKPQSLAGFILLMQKELQEAVDAWAKDVQTPRNTCLEEILQVASVAVAALERYGVSGSAIPTDDLTLKD